MEEVSKWTFMSALLIIYVRDAESIYTIKLVGSQCAKHPDLETFLIWMGYDEPLTRCAATCNTLGCYSLLYNNGTSECRTYSSWLWYPGPPMSGWRYYRHAEFPENQGCGTEPVAPTNGYFVSSSGTYVGDTATYACTESFVMSGGSGVIDCLVSGTWNTSLVCEPPAYMIRIQSNNLYWYVSPTTSMRCSTLVQDNSDNMRFLFQLQSDGYFRIVVKATGLHLHEDGSNQFQLNSQWQPDDSFTRFLLTLQEDNSYRFKMKTNDGYIGWNSTDSKLRAQGMVDTPNNRFYLELNGEIVTPF